jgi:hypothetical protein
VTKYKVLGAKDYGKNVRFCQTEVEAENKEQAEISYLNITNHEYRVIRVDEIKG